MNWLLKFFGLAKLKDLDAANDKLRIISNKLQDLINLVSEKKEEPVEPVEPQIYATLHTTKEQVDFTVPIQLPSITMKDAMLPRNGQLMFIYDAKTMLPIYCCLTEDFVSIASTQAQIDYWDKLATKQEKAAVKNAAKQN